MTVLDQMKILIQKAHDETKKHGKLLTDEALVRMKEAQEHCIVSDAIEGIYFTEEELKIFRLMDEARLPASVQTQVMKKYCELMLGIKMD